MYKKLILGLFILLLVMSACSKERSVTVMLMLRDNLPYNTHHLRSTELAIKEYTDKDVSNLKI